MPTHIHVGGIDFLKDGFYILLWLFLFRVIQVKFANTAVGRGLAFIH